jgi:hypothetical protein
MVFDHDLKLARALSHLKDLERETRRWLETDPCTVRYEVDLKGRRMPDPLTDEGFSLLGGAVLIPGISGFVVPDDPGFGQGVITALATATEEPPTDPLSVLIGDALHNLRSSLDILAYALASAYTKPLTEQTAQDSEFPIFGDEDRKGNAGVGAALFGNASRKIAGWHPSAQAAVERLQPYQRGQDFRTDPLWILHELDRFSKHRLLHPVVAGFNGAVWDLSKTTNVGAIGPGFFSPVKGTVKTDTPIARIAGVHPIDPNADVHIELRPALDVAFSEAAPAAAEEQVVATLGGIYNYIVESVLPVLTPYL